MKKQNKNLNAGGQIYVWQKMVLNFKPLIFAVMCVFTLSACEATGTSAVDYPVTASYDKTFLKNHSRQVDGDDEIGAGATLLILIGASAIGWVIGRALNDAAAGR